MLIAKCEYACPPLEENLKSLDEGPLNEDEMVFIKKYGDLIHSKKKWFM